MLQGPVGPAHTGLCAAWFMVIIYRRKVTEKYQKNENLKGAIYVKKILKLSERLYVDLETGDCRREEMPIQEEAPCRLTDGQLKILGCLVRNQGHVCTWDILEGLFDSESGDGRLSATKNHISRIKKALCSVDPGFGQEAAKKVFQSVHGRGYMFCLPKNGKVIEVKTPVDGMVQVDWEFIKSQQLEPGPELENLKNVFYGITGDREVIMQAVCNGIHISDVRYQKLLKQFSRYVFGLGRPAAPVFLMGDGGSGKSTLLCQFAVQTAKDRPGWNVMYLDISNLGSSGDTFRQIFSYLYQNGVSRTRKNVLCVDSPHENPDGFRALYQILTEEKNPNIYLVVAERASLMMNLLESNKIFQRNSYIRGFYIDNGEEGDGRKYFRSSFVQFEDVKKYFFPQELKMDIVGKMITQFAGRRKLVGEIVGESTSALIYRKKTISDAFMDFKRNYNGYAKKREGTEPDSYVPQISMDWDEWKVKCRPLDADCTGLKLSEAFPYLAACYMFGAKVTYGFIKKMTGYPYKSEIQRLFPQGMGESIQYANGRLVFRHDTVADNYFAFHPEISLQDCMEELVAGSHLNKKTVNNLMRKVFFSFYNNEFAKITDRIDVRKLMGKFQTNTGHRKDMEKEFQDLIFLESFYLFLTYRVEETEEEERKQSEEVSDSFRHVLGKTSDESNQILIWTWYLSLSMQYYYVVPDALREFVTSFSQKGDYKNVDFLKEIFASFYEKEFILMEEIWENCINRYGDIIFEGEGGWRDKTMVLYISETDENCLDLIYLYLNNMGWIDDDFIRREYPILDRERLEKMILRKKNGMDLRNLFRKWLDLPGKRYIMKMEDFGIDEEEEGNYYLFSVIQELLKNRIYEEPYETLMKLDYEGMKEEGKEQGLCYTLGMMYSLFPWENPYYRPELAIGFYQRALTICEEGEKHNIWPEEKINNIYLSLAELHYACKQYKEAKEVCEKAGVCIMDDFWRWRNGIIFWISSCKE